MSKSKTSKINQNDPVAVRGNLRAMLAAAVKIATYSEQVIIVQDHIRAGGDSVYYGNMLKVAVDDMIAARAEHRAIFNRLVESGILPKAE